MYCPATVIVIMLSVSFATACMKLLDNPWYSWFDHARTPLNTSIFFFAFAAGLACVLSMMAESKCPRCGVHWLSVEDVDDCNKGNTPHDV